MSLKFRSDINGLRALAVISVVLYHFNVKFFNGGFIGVDVFFVISGFLMTSIILGKLDKNNFSILGFYFDRARRIIPALSFLVVALSIVCWFLLLPVDYETLGKHIYSSILFISNIEYFHEINYFDASANKKWLLHTWSLSVEWQFYIIYPLILMALHKVFNIKTIKVFLLGAFSLSLMASIYFSYTGNQAAAFYLLPSRAWEMIAGGLVYLAPKIQNITIRRFMQISGIGILILCVLLMSKFSVWPGYLALIPVIATMLILTGNIENNILSNPVVQFFGKTSYSIYLWHWPIVVGLSYLSFTSTTSTTIGVLLSIFLGALSFYLVENPSRNILKVFSKKLHIEFGAFILIVSIPFLIGYMVYVNHGIPSRYPFSLLTSEQISQERARYWGEGDKENPVPKNGDKKFVIIGNSHGIDLTYSLIENGFKGDIQYLRTTNFCSNFGATPNIPEYKKTCSDIFDKVINNPSLRNADYILLHDDWAVVNLPDLKSTLLKIRSLTKAPIYVFGPKMMFTLSPSEISALAMSEKKFTIEMINDYATKYYVSNRFTINDEVKSALLSDDFKNAGATYIDTLRLQCGTDVKCNIIDKDSKKYYYFDPGHFTSAGALHLGKELKISNPELFPSK